MTKFIFAFSHNVMHCLCNQPWSLSSIIPDKHQLQTCDTGEKVLINEQSLTALHVIYYTKLINEVSISVWKCTVSDKSPTYYVTSQ